MTKIPHQILLHNSQFIFTLQQMKLVFKYNQDVRLYADQIDYEHIIQFVKTSFQIDPEAISLTFEDEDKDCISIFSQEDIDTMLAVFEDKEYVKISVQNSKSNAELDDHSPAQIQSHKTTEPRLIESKPRKIDSKERSKSRRNQDLKEIREHRRHQKESLAGVPQLKEKKHHRHSKSRCHQDKEKRCGRKRQRFEQMNNFFNELVAKLVDQRLNALLPCLKEQILKGEDPILPIHSDVIHAGVQCKGCNIVPITGVMYQCPKCSDFNLCEKCEEKIQHNHNLLKIKKAQSAKLEADEETFLKFKECFKGVFRGHHRRGDSSSSDKSRSKRKWKGHHYLKKVWGLSFIFGGQPEKYTSFVEANEDLKPRETFRKYAKENNISDEEFNKKFIEMRCQKLSRCFGNDPESYKQFVASTIDMGQKEMMHAFYQSGIEKGETRQRCWKGGRFFNFKNTFWTEKKENTPEKSKEKCKQEKLESNQSLLEEPKPRDTPEIARAKGAILVKMIEIFGAEGRFEYSKLIDSHFAEGQESIINLWINHLCQKKK